MENSKNISLVKDEYGNTCIMADSFLNQVNCLFHTYKYMINLTTGEIKILHVKFEVTEVPEDEDSCLITCIDCDDKTNIIRKQVALTNLEKYFLDSEESQSSIANTETFVDYLSEFSKELFKTYYADKYILMYDVICNSNMVFYRDKSPIFISGKHTSGDDSVLFFTEYKKNYQDTMGLMIDFSTVDSPEISYIYSPYECIRNSLLDLEENIDKDNDNKKGTVVLDEAKNIAEKDLDVSAVVYNKSNNCVLKIQFKFNGIYFLVTKVTVTTDTNEFKDFAFNNDDNPAVIFNHIADNLTSSTSAEDILDMFD